MKIFSVKSDHENYKFMVYENDEQATLTRDFEGQSLGENWTPPRVQIFVEPRKKKDSRSDKFDASCYFAANLWVKDWVAKLLQKEMHREIEILPLNGIGVEEPFFFINVLRKIEALKKPISSMSEIMELARNRKMRFEIKTVENEFLFRDVLLKKEYFCTEKFIEFVNKNEIKGLRFIEEGNAE